MIEGPERKGPRSGIRAGPKSREETPAMGAIRLAKTVPETPRVLAKAPAGPAEGRNAACVETLR